MRRPDNVSAGAMTSDTLTSRPETATVLSAHWGGLVRAVAMSSYVPGATPDSVYLPLRSDVALR